MSLPRFSFGTGDRFGHQGAAQLKALQQALRQGVDIAPVWNKSHREHQIIGSEPGSVRREADRAVADLEWEGPYFVDADHIGMETVDLFLESSDFFTIDVADEIGVPAEKEEIEAFIKRHADLVGEIRIAGIEAPFHLDEEKLRGIASDFLRAVQEVDRVYGYLLERKESKPVIEVSMDEVESPQTPIELLLILRMLADYEIQLDTIAPKFTGRFNKGVDYVGDVDAFATEFEQDLLVIDHAVREFGLPEQLKLSVHSGSDKFSLYGPMRRILEKHDKGIHLKTAGTTWLEELIGLALANPEGAEMVREIYRRARDRFEELTGPYATVIAISPANLPSAADLAAWDGEQLADTLRHQPDHPLFNADFRQLLHCAYKIAGEMGTEYTDLLKRYSDIIGEQVTYNLFDRHIKPLFIGNE